ncbi:hypothetical protein [Actinomadura meridiana]|uniref:hypothetical protein n=1 Tax=Actinomadura meridiana TaxID=559626 RepID=UPI0031EDA12E
MTLVIASVLVCLGRPAPARAENPAVPAAAGQLYGARTRVTNDVTIAAGATATVQIAGVGDLPDTGLASVWLNVASRAQADGNGSLIVYPSGTSVPSVTSGRYQRGGWNHDLLLVKVGTDGKIKIRNEGPRATPVVVNSDVYGYTLTAAGSSAGSSYVGISPARLAKGLTVAAGGSTTFEVLGKGGLPASGVSHVVFTLTANSTGTTKLVAHASGSPVSTQQTNLDLWTDTHRENLVMIPVGADGKVAISNIGTSPATFFADASGYFASPTATLAGSVTQAVRPVRLGGTVDIPADGSYTLAPLGQNGIPASGVTAVALNLTLRSAATGFVRVYPSGEETPVTRTVTYPDPGLANSGFVAAKLGSDGKIVVKNWKNVAVTAEFDVFAYFTPSTGCTQATAAAAGAAPVPPARDVEIEKKSPMAVTQATLASGETVRALEYAYVNDIGQLVHGQQPQPDQFGDVQWETISGNEAFTGRPGLAEQADGRLHVVAHHADGTVWARTQKTKEPPAWDAWVNYPKAMASHATVTRYGDTLVTFAVDADGVLWALPQRDPNGAYGSWIKLGFSGLVGTPVAVEVGDGVQVFALNSSGTWQTALYTGGLLSRCASLGGTGFAGTAALVPYPGSKIRVVAATADGTVKTTMQGSDGAFSGTWDTVGTQTVQGSPTALLSPAGKAEIVARGTDGRLYATGETAQGSGAWRSWAVAQDPGDTFVAATDPVAFAYTVAGGAKWAFVARDADQAVRFFQAKPAGVRAGTAADSPTRFTPHTLPKPPVK